MIVGLGPNVMYTDPPDPISGILGLGRQRGGNSERGKNSSSESHGTPCGINRGVRFVLCGCIYRRHAVAPRSGGPRKVCGVVPVLVLRGSGCNSCRALARTLKNPNYVGWRRPGGGYSDADLSRAAFDDVPCGGRCATDLCAARICSSADIGVPAAIPRSPDAARIAPCIRRSPGSVRPMERRSRADRRRGGGDHARSG